jgi:flagellar hook-associated protein 3 FlgL
MTITSYGTGAYRSARTSEFVTTRTQLDDLQRQLTTQKRSETYGGLGIDRRVSLDINAKVSAIDSWLSGIERAQVNLKLQSQAVEGIASMASSIRTDISTSSYIPMSGGRTGPQILAEDKFSQAIDLLNIDVNGRYLFSGRATDEKTADNAQVILYGDGNGRAGLEQLIKERAIADGLVADPANPGIPLTGRLIAGGATNVVSITKDAVHDEYGFTLASLTIGANAPSLPSGTPPSVSFALATQPQPGEVVTLRLVLPDGTKQVITLTANGSSDDGFAIGADTNETATNLRAALSGALERETQISLKAASAVWTAEDFFTQNPPLRIDPPYDVAPTARAAGSEDTVVWYRGDTRDPDLARTRHRPSPPGRKPMSVPSPRRWPSSPCWRW